MVMKNWDPEEMEGIRQLKETQKKISNLPLVLGPAFAIESKNGSVCFKLKFSSTNLLP